MNALRLFARARGRRSRLFGASRVPAFRTLRSLGQKVLKRDISPHQLRHGRTYDLVGRSVHPVIASKAPGHASLSSILAYYHPTEEDLRKALQGS
jgi:integrase